MDKNELVGLIIVTAFVVFVIFGVPYVLGQRNIQKCTDLAEDIGRSTRWQDECQVEIAPGLWVDEGEVVYYLDFVEAVP